MKKIAMVLLMVVSLLAFGAEKSRAISIGFDPNPLDVVEGDSFTVDIFADIDEQEAIIGWDLDLTYDTSLMSLDSITVDPLWTQMSADGDGLGGTVGIADPIYGDDMLLATLTFTCLGMGTSDLVLSAGLGEGFAVYGLGLTQAFEFVPGEVNQTSPPIPPTPEIYLNKDSLNFGADLTGNTTPPQTFLVDNIGGGILNWTVSTDQSWLNAGPSSGIDTGVVSVSVDPSGLTEGTFAGTLSVMAINASNSPQSVLVTLVVYNNTGPPFGVFETPVDGSTVSGSIPVTGWALDDIGVVNLKIYRQETPSLVYIADAAFAEGARPDVEVAYPDYPMHSQAGWGYMMLTHFLPNGGNGTFTLLAVATDQEGNEVTLGSKTIVCDNANAVKPFGAIETPEQGGVASGSSFINWGWVLTPQPNTIPTDGSTINVYIDGVNMGHPTYNIYREDIATLFPGYNNSNGAVGYFQLDTTLYSNGVHTIYWTATDDAGNTDGIGSRYFIIQNLSPPPSYEMTISKDGTGNGTVTSNPTGLNCGSDCSEMYNYGTSVTLTATPDSGSTFAGWNGGGCSGTGTCTVTMDADKNVTATFEVASGGTPTASTGATTGISTTAATLNGTVNANGSSTTVTFEYGLTAAYGTTVTADQSPVTGGTNTAVSRTITGLTNNMTYHYRVAAQNAHGTAYGADMTFTTNAANAPTVTTVTATNITAVSATSGGNVIDEGGAPVTARGVCWSTAPNPTTADNITFDGTGTGAFTSSITGLTELTTYYVKAYATNSFGTSYGAEMTFMTTAIGPTAATHMASAVGTTGATLNGTVNANNSSTTVTFEYGLTTAYGSTVTADQSPVTGAANTAVNKTISGLASDAIYHYRVVAQNAQGTTYGGDMTFITTIGPPGAATNGATGISRTSATLNGTVTANNSSTTVTFEYGLDTSYGATVTAAQSPVAGVNVPVTLTVAGLASNTTYHYRVVAQNAHGIAYGEDISFTTTQDPAPPDFDNDGNPDSLEQGPNGNDPYYDGNGDSIPDWLQCNVSSFTTFTNDGNHYLTIEAPQGQCFQRVGVFRTFPALPPWVSLPFGYITFQITGLQDGECTTVIIYLDGESPQTYYKYGPTPDNPVAHWYEFSFDGQTGAIASGNTMVLHLCDGKRGDHDLTENGEVLEPGGPAAVESRPVHYFPYIANTRGDTTKLGIINWKYHDVTGTIDYYGADGTLLESDVLALLGQGKIEISSEDIPSETATAIVFADGNVAGFGRFLTLGGKCYAIPGTTRLGHLITIPFAHTSSNWRTGIGLFNPGDEDATVTITDDSDRSTDIRLTAKEQHFFWVEATESPHRITANANIAAVEIIESLTSGGDIAGILLGTTNSAELYVPAISFGGSDFTGIGMCNPSCNSCSVTAYGYDAGCSETEISLGLLAGESKMSANLSNTCATDTLWVKITDVANDMSTPFGSVALPLQALAAYGEDGTEKMGAVSLNTLKFKEGLLGVVESEVIPTLTLMNPNSTDATVTITAYAGDGTVRATEELIILTGGNITSLVDSLVGGITLSSEDYTRIESDVELYGFETIYPDGRMEILPILK